MATDKQGKTQVQLELVFDIPGDMPTHFATNMVVQNTGQEFVLSFFEVRPPILLGPPETNRRVLEEMGRVTAHCVGRFIVTPDRMKTFFEVLRKNMEATEAPEGSGTK